VVLRDHCQIFKWIEAYQTDDGVEWDLAALAVCIEAMTVCNQVQLALMDNLSGFVTGKS
jgi:hypothetical protein